jgi:hypothetical protein
MTPVSDRSWGLAEGGTNKTSATNGANHDRSRLDRLRCELDHRRCELGPALALHALCPPVFPRNAHPGA